MKNLSRYVAIVLFAAFMIPMAASAQFGAPPSYNDPQNVQIRLQQQQQVAQQTQGNSATLQTSQSSSGGVGISCSNLTSSGLNGVVSCFISILNTAMYVLMSLAVFYVVYGAFIMIANEEKREDGKKIIYYGIIGLFVMISIWGLVNILDNTFQLSGQGPRRPPSFN